MLLDLGSGPSPREGYEGVDLYPGPGVTWQCNLNYLPWNLRTIEEWEACHFPDDPIMMTQEMVDRWNAHPSLKDSSVDGVSCHHLVEHIEDLTKFMGELWRVCKPGAQVEISHPYQFNVRAWQDPTHVRALNEISWFYFDAKWRGNRPEFGDTDFELVELDAVPEENWKEMAKEDPNAFERACRNQINVISDLRVTLRCRK
jgi:SAM-dependent methyltransferase